MSINPVVKPRVCIVGPVLGRNQGWVVSQGEIVAGHFQEEGYQVKITSDIPNRVLRLGDIVRSLIAWQKEYDIVILMVFSGPAFGIADIASLVARALHKPIILWFHGGNLPDFSKQHPIWVKRVLKRGKIMVSPSGYLAHYYQKLGFNVEIIPNVLDLGDYPFRQRKFAAPHLLWMRTFHDLYHPEMAIEVFTHLRRAYPDACLTMGGQDRGKLWEIKKMAQDLGVIEYIHFPGFMDMASKQHEFARNDIYINTNRVDNMPVSVLEAAAFGLPVVATSVGGIPFLLEHEKTGLLVKSGDAAAMVDAIDRLIKDPDLVEHLSNEGRQLAENSGWPRVKTKWEQIFDRALAHD
jgi:L-malate glycosyltransferase